MGKRGKAKPKGKKTGPNEGAMSSPQPNAEKITRFFAASPKAAQESATDTATVSDAAAKSAVACAGLPASILTPESTPTKSSSTPLPEDLSPDRTLPYPIEPEDSSTLDLVKAATTNSHGSSAGEPAKRLQNASSAMQDVRHSKNIPENTSKTQSMTQKAGASRSLQGQLEGAAAGSAKKTRRRRGKKSGKAGTKASDVQSPTVPKSTKTEESVMKTMKDFFPVRRSDRRCKSRLEADKKIELEEAILSNREIGLEVQDIIGKGRGVIATQSFRRGDFVVEYAGDLISIPEAKDREVEYKKDSSVGCYMYYFERKNRKYCIDATRESGRLGRLLNHSRQGNCCTRLVDFGDRPYLILVAKQDIESGEELLYDYGDRSRETLESHPWLAL